MSYQKALRRITKANGFPVFTVYFRNVLPRGWRAAEQWADRGDSGYWAQHLETGKMVKVRVSTQPSDSLETIQIARRLEKCL